MSAEALARSETIPKICIVGAPRADAHIATRYFTPQSAHPSLAVSGGCALASACLIEGTVARQVSALSTQLGAEPAEIRVAIENPAGILETVIKAAQRGDEPVIAAAAYRRNAQILVRGSVPLYHASSALVEALIRKRADVDAERAAL
jgi:2-methylaconitate cis-trans-isomerase PrpF